MIHVMSKYYSYLLALLLLPACTSCKRGKFPAQQGEPLRFTFAVTARTEAGAAADEEQLIRSLYVYVFGTDGSSDRYVQTALNGGAGQAGEYTVREMEVYSEGEKRIYAIANPPAYIASQLTADCNESRLRGLLVAMQSPVATVSRLPQNADGVSDPGDTGFPMGNAVVAYVEKNGAAGYPRQVILKTAAGGLPIESIPLFRSFGKVSVQAYLKDGNTEPVTVTDVKIYNYTADGLMLPVWQAGEPDWMEAADASGTRRIAVWNPAKRLDLNALAEKETKLVTTATSVFSSEAADGTSGRVPATSDSPQNAVTITSFYLCQNSYGAKVPADRQEGLADAVGNRTTRMLVSLSDGRSTEIVLPYLRRNDHLTVRLGITQYAILFQFSVWNLMTVTPDWSDEVESGAGA